MYSVYGRTVTKHANGSVTIKADIVNDRTEETVEIKEYTGATVHAVRAEIANDLHARIASETDAALELAVVGKLLGSI